MQRLGFRVARRVRVAEKGKKDSGYAFTELGRDRFQDGIRLRRIEHGRGRLRPWFGSERSRPRLEDGRGRRPTRGVHMAATERRETAPCAVRCGNGPMLANGPRRGEPRGGREAGHWANWAENGERRGGVKEKSFSFLLLNFLMCFQIQFEF